MTSPPPAGQRGADRRSRPNISDVDARRPSWTSSRPTRSRRRRRAGSVSRADEAERAAGDQPIDDDRADDVVHAEDDGPAAPRPFDDRVADIGRPRSPARRVCARQPLASDCLRADGRGTRDPGRRRAKRAQRRDPAKDLVRGGLGVVDVTRARAVGAVSGVGRPSERKNWTCAAPLRELTIHSRGHDPRRRRARIRRRRRVGEARPRPSDRP